MNTLIIVAHPDKSSLTHAVADRIKHSIERTSKDHKVELADITKEGFDPRFNINDLASYRRQQTAPQEILAEQKRVDQANTLVLVYPIYWWSMPAILKGWIDRVFSNGWAFDYTSETGIIKKKEHLKVHILGIGATDLLTYERHGYDSAMTTQIDHGIFNFCGAEVLSSKLLLDSEGLGAQQALKHAEELGVKIGSQSKL